MRRAVAVLGAPAPADHGPPVDHEQSLPSPDLPLSLSDRLYPGVECVGLSFSMDCHLGSYKPFFTTCVIEYAIISAAVMYVLWRNVCT